MFKVLIAAPLPILGVTGFLLDQNLASFLAAVVTLIVMTVATINWLDRRVAKIVRAEIDLLRVELGLKPRSLEVDHEA